MAITKEIAIDQITILENGVILYRKATRIIEDGVQLSQTYHRTSLVPGQDVSNESQKVQDVCNLTWTQEIIDAYKKQQEQNNQDNIINNVTN